MSTPLDSFDVNSFLKQAGVGKTLVSFRRGSYIYQQGDVCDAVYYIQNGSVKVGVTSEHGKEAVVGVLRDGDFVGEECVSTLTPFRSSSASALADSFLLRIGHAEMRNVIHEQPEMATLFIAYLLARTSRIQSDLVDQLFNSSEKRLARMLLLLANFGKDGEIETLVPRISQEALAAMIGTTRSRVSFFLNRFRKLGYIEYSDRIRVNKSLLQVILHD